MEVRAGLAVSCSKVSWLRIEFVALENINF